jgi:hypothetical protein
MVNGGCVIVCAKFCSCDGYATPRRAALQRHLGHSPRVGAEGLGSGFRRSLSVADSRPPTLGAECIDRGERDRHGQTVGDGPPARPRPPSPSPALARPRPPSPAPARPRPPPPALAAPASRPPAPARARPRPPAPARLAHPHRPLQASAGLTGKGGAKGALVRPPRTTPNSPARPAPPPRRGGNGGKGWRRGGNLGPGHLGPWT